ncbi:nicotinate-nucleotide diphosphorylase (carboxylating) [bacterium DOLJORAL78_65_58]|nr:MAG: nicotinate-nucleotide diphosphorylase (carboxylating) [bacterium DOLZORAL124_64_63]PIE76716.1 MAG: nicotinate-nucleotide diphosphorylase (carboxylating) [bacterium DOLJORAL78_65_58]
MAGDFGFPAGEWTRQLVRHALAEDVGPGDATTSITVTEDRLIEAVVTSREEGVIAGLPVAEILFAELGAAVSLETRRPDGSPVAPGDVVSVLRGAAAAILTGERILLNFLQQLSGIASLTARYVAQVAGTRCQVLDTRKTLPGYRHLAKYAVRCGGGHNHRMGLYDRIMLKDNHWATGDGAVAELVRRGRERYPDLAIEVEVDTLAQLEQVLPLGVEWIMLDNFSHGETREAVALRDASGATSKLESSGNVNLDTLRGYALAGVDAASVGRLTHSVRALDLGLDMDAG